MAEQPFTANPAKLKVARAGAPRWMVTFADLMALLFAFFVLLLSFSDVNKDTFDKNASEINEAFNNARDGSGQTLSLDDLQRREQDLQNREGLFEQGQDILDRQADRDRRKAALVQTLQSSLSTEIDESVIQLVEDENGVILRFPSKTAFPAGGREISNRMALTIDKLSSVLKSTKGDIVVTGHTDNAPISTDLFRSNWSLSTERAVSVVHYLLESSGVPASRVAARGLADSRPLTTNDTPENQAKNRRVEILVRVPLAQSGGAKLEIERAQ
jgi:chemotaxis protein MotB